MSSSSSAAGAQCRLGAEANHADDLDFLGDAPLDAFMRILLNDIESQNHHTMPITNRARLALFFSQLTDDVDRQWFEQSYGQTRLAPLPLGIHQSPSIPSITTTASNNHNNTQPLKDVSIYAVINAYRLHLIRRRAATAPIIPAHSPLAQPTPSAGTDAAHATNAVNGAREANAANAANAPVVVDSLPAVGGLDASPQPSALPRLLEAVLEAVHRHSPDFAHTFAAVYKLLESSPAKPDRKRLLLQLAWLQFANAAHRATDEMPTLPSLPSLPTLPDNYHDAWRRLIRHHGYETIVWTQQPGQDPILVASGHTLDAMQGAQVSTEPVEQMRRHAPRPSDASRDPRPAQLEPGWRADDEHDNASSCRSDHDAPSLHAHADTDDDWHFTMHPLASPRSSYDSPPDSDAEPGMAQDPHHPLDRALLGAPAESEPDSASNLELDSQHDDAASSPMPAHSDAASAASDAAPTTNSAESESHSASDLEMDSQHGDAASSPMAAHSDAASAASEATHTTNSAETRDNRGSIPEPHIRHAQSPDDTFLDLAQLDHGYEPPANLSDLDASGHEARQEQPRPSTMSRDHVEKAKKKKNWRQRRKDKSKKSNPYRQKLQAFKQARQPGSSKFARSQPAPAQAADAQPAAMVSANVAAPPAHAPADPSAAPSDITPPQPTPSASGDLASSADPTSQSAASGVTRAAPSMPPRRSARLSAHTAPAPSI